MVCSCWTGRRVVQLKEREMNRVKKIFLLTIVWLMVQVPYLMAQAPPTHTVKMEATLPSATANVYGVKFAERGSPVPPSCPSAAIGTMAKWGDRFYQCKTSLIWQALDVGGLWSLYTPSPPATPTVYLTDPVHGLALGTNAKEFRLTIDGTGTTNDTGIIAKIDNYGAGATLTTTGIGTRFIWYPKKIAFRVGMVTNNGFYPLDNGTAMNDDFIGLFSSVTGGKNNVAPNIGSFVGGGEGNLAAGTMLLGYSAVVGGIFNVAGDFAFVGGGAWNEANGINAVVVGGGQGLVGTIADGNKANGAYSFIGGGARNVIAATADYAVIGGGDNNDATASTATVAGGLNNQATGVSSFIGGGSSNTATGLTSTVSGGISNIAGGINTTVGGGFQNYASGENATVAGGNQNRAGGVSAPFHPGATVGGGILNTADADYSTIAGGQNNDADGNYASIVGGSNNNADGINSTVLGGGFNTSNGGYAIAGGDHIVVNGNRSLGMGKYLTVAGDESFVFAHYGGQTSVPFNNAFVVLSNNAAIGHNAPASFPPSLDAKLTVWSEPLTTNADNVAVNIRDVLQLQATATVPTCANASDLGKMYLNSSTHAVCICNDTTGPYSWKPAIQGLNGGAPSDCPP